MVYKTKAKQNAKSNIHLINLKLKV